MLLQSHAGYIHLFPAIPGEWTTCSFTNFRTQGAFLVDANRLNGQLQKVSIRSEKGGKTKVKLGDGTWKIRQQKNCDADLSEKGWLTLTAQPGGYIEINSTGF